MAKIEIEIPDDYVKFIEEWQRWRGEPVSVAEYVQGSMKCLLEADYGWVHGKDQKTADELYALLKSGEAAEA
jgi:Arc/MetJ-type ribon-helix-helix transcriptional regulator